jgi:hypothetical protein
LRTSLVFWLWTFLSALEVSVLIKTIGLAVLLASFASVSSAGPIEKLICKYDGNKAKFCAEAPEIDPASAMAGLTLLLGGLVVLRGRTKGSAG